MHYTVDNTHLIASRELKIICFDGLIKNTTWLALLTPSSKIGHGSRSNLIIPNSYKTQIHIYILYGINFVRGGSSAAEF